MLEAQHGMVRRDAGELVRTPERAQDAELLEAPVEAPRAIGKAITLLSLMDAWVIERKPASKTVEVATAGIKGSRPSWSRRMFGSSLRSML